MPRYALLIEYDGAPYSGWQRQPDVPSVQGVIEQAFAKIAPDAVVVTGAGRTDAGVHAMGQVAHVHLDRDWSGFKLKEALNAHIGRKPVAILEASKVDEAFHARFSAMERRYIYRIRNRRAPLTFEAGQMWHVRRALDVERMRAGAAHLIGHHDFTTFRSTICQAKSPVKTLDRLDVSRIGDEIVFEIVARSFLHNQVRSFVGSLERVGAGTWEPVQIKRALEARDRKACGPVAPACGLYLAQVTYPSDPFSAR
jgi:tRNA pseudouridine38-40 synthase